MKHKEDATYNRGGMLRKWIPSCVAIDFENNVAQAAYNGLVFEKIKPLVGNADFKKAYQHQYGGKNILEELKKENVNLIVNLGTYFFDRLF